MTAINLADMNWRHHELGMLQAEFSGTTRIHLWDARLRGDWTGNEWRAVHDHRFDLYSTIQYGRIEDVSYEVWPECACPYDHPFTEGGPTRGRGYFGQIEDEFRKTVCHEILNAKKQIERGMTRGGQRVVEGTTVAQRVGPVLVRETGRRVFVHGASYFVPRRAFHTTIIRDFAITTVTRANFDDRPARILGEPDSAINMGTDFGPTIERAQKLLNEDSGLFGRIVHFAEGGDGSF